MKVRILDADPSRSEERHRIKVTNLLSVKRESGAARPMIDALIDLADVEKVTIVGRAQNEALLVGYYIGKLKFERSRDSSMIRYPQSSPGSAPTSPSLPLEPA